MLRFTTLSLLAAAAFSAPAAAQVYLAQSDLVVIEMEASGAPEAWGISTATPGYTGESYIRWNGPNLFNQPGQQGVFAFDFEVANGGTYRLNVRNRHENPDPTEENDVWIRMDGGTWVKTFSNQAGSVGAWTWESRFDYGHGNQPQASYNLSPGVHRVEFSGRSFGFKMDRVHIYLPSVSNALDPNQPVSPQRFGQEYGQAVANSTGAIGRMQVTGSPVVTENNVILTALDLPTDVPGFFIASRTIGFTPNPAGSQGNLLLDGSIGRFDRLLNMTNPMGSAAVRIDLTEMPMPQGTSVAFPGETWHFQFWHRDTTSAGATSNFTSGISVVLQ
ncbi:hypothetical protein Poly30_11220 [Planctomycetes bacterium Poly30]|uniref:Uncharacterized protein n=1 Tax=Saltatorellus ferox TaxID=2528018 RepID=A0A518ENG4_9BACT|nr:hypothetical protein Poly30_11220 [Planctomycetes bacterium Poly30]